MTRVFLRILRGLYPNEFPPAERSPEQRARQVQRGRNLARLKPWQVGRIGRIERRVHTALIVAAGHTMSTADLVQMIYCNGSWDQKFRLRDRNAEPPRLRHWMYERVRKAAATFADRAGRGRGGIQWRLRKDAYYRTIRAQKRERYRGA
jgi:hypothetical protein